MLNARILELLEEMREMQSGRTVDSERYMPFSKEPASLVA